MTSIDYNIKIKPLLGEITSSGDLGFVRAFKGHYLICLLDVLGHGPLARELAVRTEKYIDNHHCATLEDMLKGLHNHVLGSRGMVIGLVKLDPKKGEMQCCGIGNISIRVIGSKSYSVVLGDGIVGYGRINPITKVSKFAQGDLLIMHSDGLKSSFNSFEIMKIIHYSAKTITAEMMTRFGGKEDDASCIAVKYCKG